MLAGVKFIPRDQIDKDENLKASAKQKQKKGSGSKEGKHRRERSSGYSSSDGEELERIKKGSKKKWYSSDEYLSSSYSSENESEGSSDRDRKKRHTKKKKRSSSSRTEYGSEDLSSASDSYSDRKDKHKKRSRKEGKKKSGDRSQRGMKDEEYSEGGRGTTTVKDGEIVRKKIGLEWMLRPEGKERTPAITVEDQPKEIPVEEIKKVNPKELNPYYKDDGSGYPEDNDEPKSGVKLPSSVVGDGGASWRLKAWKRAQEQAAREGQGIHEVVGERHGSLGELVASVHSNKAAHSRAHLHAIQSRKKGVSEEQQPGSNNDMDKKDTSRKDVSIRHPEMREPNVQGSFSWRKQKGQKSRDISTKDSALLADAVSSINRFSNDGSFLSELIRKQTNDSRNPVNENVLDTRKPSEASAAASVGDLSANQLAAKAYQLKMKGKLEEAEELLQEVENLKGKQGAGENPMRPQFERGTNRYAMQDMSLRQKKKDDDGDMHLAQKIMQNKKYSISGRADDEYDFDDGPSRKSKKKQGSDDRKVTQNNTFANRFSIQQERCLFCFENPKRPAHLVVAIGNYSYLMLPQQKPVVDGHCYVLPMQHVPATRTLDDHVWEEIRNFKKCLIMMFAKQEKDVVFLETVMGLAQQRRHCIIECIPLPQDIAKDAPLYFKKAIDEAEDEWSQHNAKKLIDTSVKGLRGSVPANFPYFHVEFGLKKGFVHVIDDETQFNSSLGLNVIRGMLELPAEDMHRRGRYEPVEAQKQAVKRFDQEWAPFDWTKQLH
ncbi:PREDICTED: CWF19-like protein 2 [Fragaria vesca subsp. vesca]|uniref:CWF19-like protein 2 n=1 Tax=Fragaria vesca subsp. vesca TaxID=101020 RepID=UPI0002C2E7FD|nr:PREDICTED: CWF19-like protein 2 [Fragaria vesca subsp. vesca]